jgi:hypothetical protein
LVPELDPDEPLAPDEPEPVAPLDAPLLGEVLLLPEPPMLELELELPLAPLEPEVELEPDLLK